MVSHPPARTSDDARSTPPETSASHAPCSNPQAHESVPVYFDETPQRWSILHYLRVECQHPGSKLPRKVLNDWPRSLQTISSSTDDCWDVETCAQAKVLFDQYHKPGSEDKKIGRDWLKRLAEQGRRTKTRSQQRAKNVVINRGESISVGAQVSGTYNVAGSTPELPDNTSTISSDLLTNLPNNWYLSDTDLGSDIFNGADISTARQEFYNCHGMMTEQSKWVLKCTGRSVEGIITKKCQTFSDDEFASSLARLWILDLSNKQYQDWFTPEEWEEICAERPVASVDEDFFKHIMQYLEADTCEDLREILYSGAPYPEGCPKRERYDYEWIFSNMYNFLRLFEDQDHPLHMSHNESWYGRHIWADVVDKCLQSIPGMTTERTEVNCHAIQARKNSARTLTQAKGGTRFKTGARFDGMTRTIEDNPYEYLVIEDSPTFRGEESSSKWLTDSMKTFKAMRDMLARLIRYSKNDPEIANLLQVFSIVTGGLHMQIHRLRHPKGHVCLLETDPVLRVPKSVDELHNLLLVLNATRNLKKDVMACQELVRRRLKNKAPEDLLDTAMRKKKKTPEPTLFTSHTP